MVRSLKRPSQRMVPERVSILSWSRRLRRDEVPADTALTSALRIAAFPNILGQLQLLCVQPGEMGVCRWMHGCQLYTIFCRLGRMLDSSHAVGA